MQAADSKDGVTRVSLIEAARDLQYSLPMFLDGLEWIRTHKPARVGGFGAGVCDTETESFVPTCDVITIG